MTSIRKLAPFLLLYSVPVLCALGLQWQGYWLLATPVFGFIIIPIFDYFRGDDTSEYQEPNESTVKGGRILVAFYAPVQLALIAFGAYQAAHSDWSLLEWALAVFTVGITSGGLGITMAHELIHRSETFLKFLGGLMLSSVCYGHFLVEHVHGHHTWIATPKDPATSRFGENLYSFYLRTIPGGFLSSLKIEKEWLRKRNKKWIHHRILLAFLGTVFFIAASYILGGINGLIFFFLQSWVAFTLLEVINYVEHYGLLRKTLPNGNYEPVGLQHSWDSRKIVSNYFLINLEHHSDHHKNPTRDFTKLRFHDEAPLLPAGYPEMVLLSFIPPLWFYFMNKRVLQTSA